MEETWRFAHSHLLLNSQRAWLDSIHIGKENFGSMEISVVYRQT